MDLDGFAKDLVRFLRQPAYLSAVGVLLLIYGAVGGNVGALLCAGCCLYLAWQLGRQVAPQSDGPGDRRAERYQARMWRVVQVAFVIGLAWGGVQAYSRLVEMGWHRLFALGVTGGIVVLIGATLWFVVTGLVRRHT
jgi:hypothetical protein